MTKEQLKSDALTKLEYLLNKYKAVKAVDTQIENTKVEETQKIEVLYTQLSEAQEALKGATTLEIARQAKNSMDDISEDIELQKAVSAKAVETKKDELETVVMEFFEAYKALKTAYVELDKEVALTINIRSLDEDEQVMKDISIQASNFLGSIKRYLIKHGIIEKGEHKYKGFHLDQAPLDSYAQYVNVVKKLKPTKDNFSSQGIK
ncbi:hypothetical protein [Pseudobacillus badius]|uniref:hypothetical protein n=1 Tax=Bacillus badius TaxID=1455 RepID=UPI0024A60A55|nr:hypothetical protein [Bacillus badius]GLY12510.1 hypothetical protein Bbad01_37260 [Bacillus badius]